MAKDHVNRTKAVYRTVYDAVLRGAYPLGNPIPAERYMAEETGTSRITVRRAYAELERDGILIREQGRGTRISDTPRGKAAPIRQVALLTALREPFALEFVHALEAVLSRKGAILSLKLTEENRKREESGAIELMEHGLRNLVVWPCGLGYAADVFSRIRVLGANVVFVDRLVPGPTVGFVGLDNRHAIESLLRHAADRGFSDFVYVAHEGLNADSDREREETFERICTRRGYTQRLVRVPWRGDIEGAIRRNKKKWFARAMEGRCAVLCVNDETALMVRKVLGSRSAVYGIDGLHEAEEAGIVSYRQPLARMASAVCRQLEAQRKGNPSEKALRTQLRGELVFDETKRCKPLPK